MVRVLEVFFLGGSFHHQVADLKVPDVTVMTDLIEGKVKGPC